MQSWSHPRTFVLQESLKAALINIFTSTIDQMTVCNVKGVAGFTSLDMDKSRLTDQTRAKKETEHWTFAICPKTRLRMSANVCLYLLSV